MEMLRSLKDFASVFQFNFTGVFFCCCYKGTILEKQKQLENQPHGSHDMNPLWV